MKAGVQIMGKIIQLDEKLSNLIAAGEVVENMASVVKELVENSIDAFSDEIQIHLLEAGLKEIKVSDNGIGMSKEDMKMSFRRHATSKIKTQHDLFHIQSLGFRGEALPSIASVSYVEMISSEGTNGYKIVYKNGKIIEEGEHAPKKGTTISVKYLFYNTPARLKHLKATTTELSYIVDYVNKIALSHPKIRFLLTNDARVLLRTNGNNDTLQVLSNIYSLDIIKDMVPFSGENGYFKISGYLTKPLHTRSNRTHISIIANDRMIKNNKIIKAISEGYKTYLPVGKYPIVFIKITVDPLLIDVNVHPSKLEVKFTEERLLLNLIRTTINEKLKQLMLIPTVEKFIPKTDELYQESLDFLENKTKTTTIETKDYHEYNNMDEIQHHTSQIKEATNDFGETNVHHLNQEDSPIFLKKTKKLPRLEYIGQFMGTYLVAQNENGLYLIDQHAAAERIRYERYKEEFGKVNIEFHELLLPLPLHLSNNEVLALLDRLDDVEKLGIKVKVNSIKGIDITHVPTWFPKGYELEYAEEIIQKLLEDKEISVKDSRNQLAKNLSCKHSIKANHFMDKSEIETLLIDLAKCENPYTCPHGRPIILHFTVYEIEKMFKRVQS
jgi:DNA mismatch repair protein MutL